MRLTRRYTFAPNSWFKTERSEGTGIWGTHFLTVGCPGDFVAVRLGFANISEQPYTIPRIVVCPSTSWNDYVSPTGGGTPITLTGLHGGADQADIVADAKAPHHLVVRPNTLDGTAAEPAMPAWSWTDWCTIRSLDPDPTTGMRVLMIRHTVERNGGQPITFVNGTLMGWRENPAVHGGYDYFCGGLKNGSDKTNFEPVNAAVLPANMMVNGSFIAAVQFLTQNAGVVGMTTGDSHHQGTSTSGSFNNYLAQATVTLRGSTSSSLPLSWVCCAVGGATSDQFFPSLDRLLQPVAPSFVVLPGWTANDPGPTDLADDVAVDRFLARLFSTAERVCQAGAVPIWLTPFPRDEAFMTSARMQGWMRMRRTILSLEQSGELVVDAGAALSRQTGDGLDGTYAPGLSTDGIHPNDQGHAVVAGLLVPVLAELLPSGTTPGWRRRQDPRRANFC